MERHLRGGQEERRREEIEKDKPKTEKMVS